MKISTENENQKIVVIFNINVNVFPDNLSTVMFLESVFKDLLSGTEKRETMALACFQQRRRYIFTAPRQADDALRQSAVIANDTCDFSHCFSPFELQLCSVGKNMLSQIVAITRWNVTGSVKEKKDA